VDGSARVDALLVADRISGFEIKSDLDRWLDYRGRCWRIGRWWSVRCSSLGRGIKLPRAKLFRTGGAFGWRPGDGTK